MKLRLLVWLALGAACSAQAQIAPRAASQASLAGGTAAAITVTAGNRDERTNCGDINPAIPGGNDGDLLVAQVIARRSAATITMTGWNVLFTDNNAGGAGTADDLQSILYWRSATGTDPDTINQSGTCNLIYARITRFGNVDVARPLETFPLPAANWVYSNADNVDTGTQEVNVANSMLVMATFVADGLTVAQPGGWTQLYDNADNSGDDIGISMNYRTEATTGTKGPINDMDLSGATSVPSHGVLFAVRPGRGNNLVVNVPAGTVDGDVMIAAVTFRPCTAGGGSPCTVSLTAPLGWTLVTPGTNTINQTAGGGTGGTGHRVFVYSRVAASEPASYTWTIGGTPVHSGAAGGIVSFSGVDTASPIVTSLGQAPTGNATSHTATQIDTSPVTDTMLVAIFTSNSSAFWTMPGTMTEQVDAPSLGAPDDLGVNLGMATELRAAAGLTGNRTASYSAPAPAADTGATLMLALRPASVVSHYEITQPSGANFATCEPAVVRITAHNAAHAAVNPPAGTILTIRTSSNTGIWQAFSVAAGDLGTAANFASSGANNGQATYIWSGTESVLQVRLRRNTLGSLGVNLNPASSPQEDATEDPTFNFSDAVWRVTANGTSTASVNTQIAGKESNVGPGAQTLFVQAVATAPATGACSALFRNQTLNVDFAAVCNNPATCSAVAGTEAALRNSGGTYTNIAKNNGAPAAYTAVSLTFSNDTNAMAPFAVRYGDAGQITIHMRYALPTTGDTFAGSSNAFVVRPFGFAFPGVTHGIDETSGVLAAAGDNFPMPVAAYRWDAAEDDGTGNPRTDISINLTDNGATPNFAATTTVDVLPGSNAAGAANGTITRQSTGNGNIAAAEFTSGASAVTDWRYSEVGNVTFTATSSNYLGSGASINGRSTMDGTGNRVGRFRPKHFAVSNPTRTNRSALGCAVVPTWSYLGEQFQLGFRLTAQNAQNATTVNYTGAYAKLNPATFANWSLGARDGSTNLIPRINTLVSSSSGSWANGVADVTLTTLIDRNTPDNPDGPFTSVNFGIAPSDADTVTMNALDFDADNNSVNERKNLGVTTELRFGRIRMENVVGSERLPLPIQIEVQHWTGTATGFRRNTDDGCTSVGRQHITLDPYTGNLNACETMVSPASVTFASGLATVNLSAPGAGNDGTVQLTLNLGTASGNYCSAIGGGPFPAAVSAGMSYLRGRTTSGTWTDNPSARAAFGLFGGQPNNFIYFRENY